MTKREEITCGAGLCACDRSCGQDVPCGQRLHRRDFLKMAGAFGLLLGCSACVPSVAESTAEPTDKPTPAPTAVPTATPQPSLPAYWPTDGWRASTPEQQGIDSEGLVKVFEFILEERYDLHSLLVIRGGYAVLEAYFEPFRRETLDTMICAGRSFFPALMGIATQQGYIEGVDQKALDFFPDYSLAEDDDPRKQTITLAHLLTNTSGLQPGNLSDDEDPVQQILGSRLIAEPGANFGFGNDPYLLSALLQAAVGVDVLSFARQHLFQPLGISYAAWDIDAHDVCLPTGLQLAPGDLARLGYLYLNGGAWDGQQVVPADWIAASIEAYTSTACGLGFGYQWWIYEFGAYAAKSGAAQCYVVPDLDLIVVSTAARGVRPALVAGIVEYLIMPAAKSPEPLPENPDAVAKLESLVEQVSG